MNLTLKIAFLAIVLGVLLPASTMIRPVSAEDDCAANTWSVNRVAPGMLVCIGEPS